MLKNYLTITFRNFLRNRNYTLINLLGLSIGVTSCIIIFLLITYELNFDRFHHNYERIYRVVLDSKSSSGINHGTATPHPFIKAFRNDFSDIALATQLNYQEEMLVRNGDEKQIVNRVIFADSLFFEVFDFEVLSGNPKVDLGEPGKVFLTRSLADKLFKDGPVTHIQTGTKVELEVAGIIADPPATSHISFSMIVSLPSFTPDFQGGLPLNEWGMTSSDYSYFVMPENMTVASIEERLKPFVKKYYEPEDADRRTLKLQPLRDIHFDEQYRDNPGTASNASASDLVVMGVLGIFILVIACINFVNLATALAIKKSKEIGIRKTLGAKRGQLTTYFLGETFLLTVFSVLISLCATEWLLSWINQFLGKQTTLSLFTNPWLALFLIGLIFFATVLSGFYPAVVLSGFNPIAVLKNKITGQATSGATVRKVLVVFQFLIAQVLIIGTLIIAGQMDYFRNKPLGFDKEAIIELPLPENKSELIEAMRARLETNPDITSISFSLGAPTSDNIFSTSFFLSEKGRQELYTTGVKPVDRFYKDTYGIKLKAGRWFTESDEKLTDRKLPEKDQRYVYIINESAMKKLGFSDPEQVIGKKITTGVYNIDSEVVGVVEDFHVTSLHEEIGPVVMMNLPSFYFAIGLKVNPNNFRETIKFLEKNWSDVFPEYYFEYEFLDQHLANLYREDERTFTLFKIFAGISIFIGCLGLYGLISFMANQKLKEVGIRKVMGASVASILLLFSKEFIKLIVIAFVIAAPVAWYFMNEWLQGFAYRIDIPWTVFLVAIASTLIIALATVSYRSVQAAVSNPAETLRTE